MPPRQKNSPLTLMKSSVSYPIRAVSLMTGVGIDTLRAWERRYGAVSPLRDERGRMYTEADVRRIRMLRDAVSNGHAIGRIARLSDEQLEKLAAPPETPPATAPVIQGRPAAVTAVDTDAIIAALERFDASGVELELSRAAALLRAPELLRDVLVPVLTEVGERWHAGRARIAHEHLLSASVRNVLGSLLRLHAKSGVPDRLLFATPAGERHEFGTLGAALLAASGGLGAIYLGPDMPADDIVAVTTVVKLDVVVLGLTELGDAKRIEAEISQIAARLDPRIELWLGGRGAERVSRNLNGRALVLSTFEALEAQLVRLGAQF
jgi:DNA-binding transcriptional MerR regulator/methylmalonyl-CoA mutase cobalamin-binding subunit